MRFTNYFTEHNHWGDGGDATTETSLGQQHLDRKFSGQQNLS